MELSLLQVKMEELKQQLEQVKEKLKDEASILVVKGLIFRSNFSFIDF